MADQEAPKLTGSPFSNVVGHDSDDSTYQRVETDERSDTTSATAARPADQDTESSVGVEVGVGGVTHESEQDETPGDAPSGVPAT